MKDHCDECTNRNDLCTCTVAGLLARLLEARKRVEIATDTSVRKDHQVAEYSGQVIALKAQLAEMTSNEQVSHELFEAASKDISVLQDQLAEMTREMSRCAERMDFWGDAYQKENWKLIQRDDECADLRTQLLASAASEVRLRGALKNLNQHLTIPAAEYVPAIPEAWKIIEQALSAPPSELAKAIQDLRSESQLLVESLGFVDMDACQNTADAIEAYDAALGKGGA